MNYSATVNRIHKSQIGFNQEETEKKGKTNVILNIEMMKKLFTLENLIDSINNAGNDVDVYVDGREGIAVCPPVNFTEAGRKYFEAALSLPVEEYCIMGEDKDYNDLAEYEEEDKGDGGKLLLAWELLISQAGYCPSSDYEKWFKK